MIVMKQLLERFANMEKAAAETLAAEPGALVGVDSLPGSEHDAKVPEEAKKPNAEVAQGLPSGAASTEGAVNGGDAKVLEEGKLTVEQALLNPEHKPEITDDALTAKEAEARLGKIVGELLSDIQGATQKQAQDQTQNQVQDQTQNQVQDQTQKQAQNQAQDGNPADASAEAKKKEEGGEKTATATDAPQIVLTDEMLSKIAAATAAYQAGCNAAEDAIAKIASERNDAVALVKSACIKAAQEAGLDPAAAEMAANNVLASAGVPAEGVAPAPSENAGAEAAAAADASAETGDVQIPDDVTEEELGEAIVDLVQSGELDVDTAKALVDELSGDAGDAGAQAGEGITEDQAAEIIANGLESGEITPEDAKNIIAAIENGDAGAAAEGAAGVADAEAQGAADAENAIKAAAAAVRANAIQKVASAVVAKRNSVNESPLLQKVASILTQRKAEQAAKAAKSNESPLLQKVASILTQRKAEQAAKAAKPAEKQASAQASGQESGDEARYIAGFAKKAAELGVDPQALAKYASEMMK